MTKRLGGEHHTAYFEPVTQPVRMRFKNGSVSSLRELSVYGKFLFGML